MQGEVSDYFAIRKAYLRRIFYGTFLQHLHNEDDSSEQEAGRFALVEAVARLRALMFSLTQIIYTSGISKPTRNSSEADSLTSN